MTDRLLALRRDSYRGENRPVFASRAGTELLPANVFRRVLAPAAVEIGLTVPGKNGKPRSAVSFHTFRHTCASLLFAAGCSVKQVQEFLGHASAAFTLETYVHLMDEGVGDRACNPSSRRPVNVECRGESGGSRSARARHTRVSKPRCRPQCF